ncbi:hypothetical protein D3C78_1611850 [compost metagenome]
MLASDNEQLKAISKARISLALLSKRRNSYRMPGHKCRLNERMLRKLLEEGIHNVTKGHMRIDWNLVLLG